MNVEALVTDEVNDFLSTLGEEVAMCSRSGSQQINDSYRVGPISFSVGNITVTLVSQNISSYLQPEGEQFEVKLSIPRQHVSNPDTDNTMPYVTELNVESDGLNPLLDTLDDLFPESPKFMYSDSTPSSYIFSERFTVTTDDLDLEDDYTVTEIVTLEVNRKVAIVEEGKNPLDAVSGDMAVALDENDERDVKEIQKQDTFEFEGREVSFEKRISGPALVDVETDEVLFYVTDKWGVWGELLKDRKELTHDDDWSSGLSNL